MDTKTFKKFKMWHLLSKNGTVSSTIHYSFEAAEKCTNRDYPTIIECTIVKAYTIETPLIPLKVVD